MSPWQRTYWAVFVANLVAALGMMSFLPFFPSLLEGMGVTERGELEIWSGICFGAAPLMAALMGPLWGSIGDRFGRKLMVLRSLLALTLFVGLMAFARRPEELLVLRLLQGAFSGFIAPSITLVSIGVPADRQGRVASGLQMAMALGAIGGPLIGAVVAELFGLAAIFAFVAITTAVGAAVVAVFAREGADVPEEDEQPAAARPRSPLAVVQASMRELAELTKNRRMAAALAVLFATQLGIGATNPQLELFVRDLDSDFLGLASSKQTALLFSGMALLGLLFMPWWGRHGDRRGHMGALCRASGLSALALALSALAPAYLFLLGVRALQGAASAGLSPSGYGVAADETRASRRGAAFGAVFSAGALAMALAAMVGGSLAALVGIRGLFAISAALPLMALLWAWRNHKRDRRGRPSPGPDSATSGGLSKSIHNR